MPEQPSYIGQWICPWLPDLGPVTFWMYAHPTGAPQPDGSQRFTGTIDDILGRATIDGVSVNGAILFNKQYDASAKPPAAKNPITFMGEKGLMTGSMDVTDAFSGYYIMDLPDSASVASRGAFILYEFDPARHPRTGRDELKIWDRDNVKYVIEAMGLEGDQGGICTGLYSASAILSFAAMADRNLKHVTQQKRREALITAFMDAHHLSVTR
jgi:hypothetical protein